MNKLFKFVVIFTPLALIFIGAWFIYPPAAPIAVGLLWWLDIRRSRST